MGTVRWVAEFNRVPVRRVVLAIVAYHLGQHAPLRRLGLSRPPTRADVEQAGRDFQRTR
jgi:hypothetical protein